MHKRSSIVLALALGACTSSKVSSPLTAADASSSDASTLADAMVDATTIIRDATAPADAQSGGAAVIADSGSTNAPGYTITITPDGQATWSNKPARNIPNALKCANAEGTATLSASLTTRFFDDLHAAGSLASLHFDQCAKSASFGSTTSLTYQQTTAADMQCVLATDAHAVALSQDINDILLAVAAACH